MPYAKMFCPHIAQNKQFSICKFNSYLDATQLNFSHF
jgi:hypothetical protein